MREIIFRGKRIDKKSFVEGFLISKKTIRKYYIDDEFMDFEVMPETIGQFTGLLDKNGNKIFEGDKVILRGHECVVFYRRGYCDYTFENIKYGGRSLNVTKANITKYGIEIIE